MRNTIDKETYTWLFKVFGMLGTLLLLVNIFLFFSNDASYLLAQKIASATMFMLVAVFMLARLEYLKAYKVATYKARKFPMWASVFVFAFVALYRLF
ncbi:MAG: hypothetical protein ACK4NY_14080 [Spirosomataceae bacterium]